MAKYKNAYTKHYFEDYARIVLNDLLGLNLMHREEKCGTDKPDLVSEDEKMGVEVTLAWSDDVGRHNKLFQQQYPKENRSEIIKNEAKRLRVEKDLYVVDNLASLWIPSGKENAIEMLTEAINKKVDKLNNNDFTKYRINNLFVSAFTLFTEDIEDFLNQFSLVIKKGNSGGENYSCKVFEEDKTEVTIGTFDEINDCSCVCDYLENGLIFENLTKGKTNQLVFGISWVTDLQENDDRTWFASDPTYC